MKTLILDESTWRCGEDSDRHTNKRGIGKTAMINIEGYKCCLGQFSSQLNKKIKFDEECFEPKDIKIKIPFLNKKDGFWRNTKLSSQAININDNENTTIEEKVTELKKLFKRKGLKIVFRKKK